MNIRLSSLATGLLAAAAVLLSAGSCWAVFYPLGPSKDEWGLKYEVSVTADAGDALTVSFTLADEGRLKPIYSATAIVFSKPDENGSRTYELKSRIELKPTKDGRRTGQVQIPKKLADRAIIKILTLTVDGRPQTGGARYYDIPLQKFLNEAAPPSVATPPAATITK